MRKSLALVLSAGLLVGLAACSSPSTPDCTGAATSGPASDGIDVTGDFGKAPTVTFGTPLDSTDVQRTILTQGDGPETGEGGTVLGTFSFFDGSTGQQLQPSSATALALTDSSGVPGLADALSCVGAGSRVAFVIPQDVLGGAVTGGLVGVVDVQETYPRAATGGDVPAVAGFPSVVHDSTGRPGITVVSGTDTTTFRSTALKKGDGPVVADGDNLLVQYTQVSMAKPTANSSSKGVLSSTWESGSPKTWTASKDNSGGSATGQALISDALVGANVGDEIIAVVPASSDASQGSADPASVWVIDILGVLPAAGAQQ
ncbi:hypothetical protein NY547_07100 [Cnuibacter physcomitrellae]|uniref:hypothetical protein n=1 Tax=Cnuibacter physcomitrellae TaxID=1619308 RepID=UPI0021757A84|nr:hypothetical protein [Cnuibacter physcomitrellae]MCS5497002.1 hypothetical protein [Cnuibacter physcomitrellae]